VLPDIYDLVPDWPSLPHHEQVECLAMLSDTRSSPLHGVLAQGIEVTLKKCPMFALTNTVLSADLVVVVHLLFIGFIVGGVFLTWRWP
jgi:hypothetical protein